MRKNNGKALGVVPRRGPDKRWAVAGLAAGCTALESAHLANCAGSVVVMRDGVATVSREELKAAIKNSV